MVLGLVFVFLGKNARCRGVFGPISGHFGHFGPGGGQFIFARPLAGTGENIFACSRYHIPLILALVSEYEVCFCAEWCWRVSFLYSRSLGAWGTFLFTQALFPNTPGKVGNISASIRLLSGLFWANFWPAFGGLCVIDLSTPGFS